MSPVQFPVKDRPYEIRFESIGGLGAHAGSQILAEACVVRMGLNAAAFSSYGSEKKGSPVRSYVRLLPGDKPLRICSPIETPDVIVFFHPALLNNPATIAGLRADGTVILNGPPGEVPKQLEALPKTVRVIRVDALKVAIETKSRPNAVLLGTLSSVAKFLDPKAILETLSAEFAGKHPEAVASNEKAFTRGATEFEEIKNPGKASGDLPIVRQEPVYGWKTQPIGGLIPVAGNSAWNNMATSRMGFIPVYHEDKCIHCGVCDLVCPDICLVWGKNTDTKSKIKIKLMGIDYRYCKGCMRCVDSCPTSALTKEAETPGSADKLRVKLFPELVP